MGCRSGPVPAQPGRSTVLEVIRPNRQTRRRRGKDDTIDAIAAARTVLAGEASGPTKDRDGAMEAMRVLRSCAAAPSRPNRCDQPAPRLGRDRPRRPPRPAPGLDRRPPRRHLRRVPARRRPRRSDRHQDRHAASCPPDHRARSPTSPPRRPALEHSSRPSPAPCSTSTASASTPPRPCSSAPATTPTGSATKPPGPASAASHPSPPPPAPATDTASTAAATAKPTPRSGASPSSACACHEPTRAYVARRTTEGLSKRRDHALPQALHRPRDLPPSPTTDPLTHH